MSTVGGQKGAFAARQSAGCALLVRPARFGYNSQTAPSNHFQHPAPMRSAAAGRARAELDRLAAALRAAGARVCVAEDTPEPVKPDAVFPNNWVSWHGDGTVVLYPLCAPNRRAERRAELLEAAAAHSGFRRQRLLDLSAHERAGRFLEGTGSLVLDHVHRVAYACRSARTDEALLREWAALLEYEPVPFDAHDELGRPLYHTNVMLAVGTRWSVVCTRAIAAADRGRVLARLRAGGREVIEITPAAMGSFAANLLELSVVAGAGTGAGPAVGAGVGGGVGAGVGVGAGPGAGGERQVLVLSTRARAALRAQPGCWPRLQSLVDAVVAVPVPTIESVGGGGVRCMLCEIPAVPA